MIRVALVDNQPIFRDGIGMMIDSHPDMQLVAEAGDGSQVAARVESHHPDVILMDVRMPTLNGVSATRGVMTRFGDAAPKVLIFTTFELDDGAANAIEAGASGFLLKDTRPEMLLESIRTVADGSQVVVASAKRCLFENHRPQVARTGPAYDLLTAREKEIMLLAAKGMSNAAIAAHEFLSEGTVKTHSRGSSASPHCRIACNSWCTRTSTRCYEHTVRCSASRGVNLQM